MFLKVFSYLSMINISIGMMIARPLLFGLRRNIEFSYHLSVISNLYSKTSDFSNGAEKIITSNSNIKIKYFKSIISRSKEEERDKIFLEGHRLIIDALMAGYVPESILFSDKALIAPLGNKLSEYIQPYADRLFKVEDKILSTVSDTTNCQGVMAIFHKKSACIPQNSSLIVLCDGISDPGNLGSIIRTAYGFGADAVIHVKGCDPWSPKVIRASMGMGLRLGVIEMNWEEVALLLSNQRLQLLLTDVSPTSKSYYDIDLRQPSIVVIGSEARGVSDEARALLNAQCVHIPMIRDLESLNAGVAAAVLLSEISRQRSRC